MNKYLNLPAWTVFIPLMLPIFIGVVNNQFGSIIYVVVYTLWLLSMGLSVNKHNPTIVQFSVPFYTFRILFSAVYVVFIALSFENEIPNWVIPIHIIAFIFLLTCLITCAKSIVNAETQKSNSFIDSLGTFLLLWFYPIGIWFIQPRLNTLYRVNTGT